MSKLLKGHSNGIVGLSGDARYVYSGSKDKTLRIWDNENLQCEHVIEDFPCGCKGVSDGGNLYIITAHGLKNRFFSVWERGSWSKLHETALEAKADLQEVILDEQRVFISARDGKVFVIDRKTLQTERILQQSENGIWDMATDSDYLYTASVDQTITAWSKRSWQPARVLRGHRANIQALAQDERFLYSIATDKTLAIWSKDSGELAHSLRRIYSRGMMGLACTESHVMTLNGSQGLKAWPIGKWNQEPLEQPDIGSKRAVVYDQTIWFGLNNGTIAVYPRGELGL